MANQKQIDEIDAKILKMLLTESRTSFTEIASFCNISVCAVRNRYFHLKKAGIITGESLHPNPKFWGYNFIVDIRVETSPKHEEKVLETLTTKAYVLGARNFGREIMAYIAVSKLDDLRNIIEDIESNPEIKRTDTLIWTNSEKIFHPENLIFKSFNDPVTNKKELKTPSSELEQILLDETDRQVAKILTQDSRTPFSNISKQLNISTHNVIQRYKKLREAKVFSLSSICVNLNALGYNAMYVVFLKIQKQSKISEIRELLLQIPNVIVLIEHTGTYDLRIDIPITNVEDIFSTIDQIRAIDGIEKVESRMTRCFQKYPLPLFNKIVTMA